MLQHAKIAAGGGSGVHARSVSEPGAGGLYLLRGQRERARATVSVLETRAGVLYLLLEFRDSRGVEGRPIVPETRAGGLYSLRLARECSELEHGAAKAGVSRFSQGG